MAELSIKQKKEWAQSLFTNSDLMQKEIAIKVGVSEKTMSRWVNEEKWQSLKLSLVNTKTNELNKLYKILENLNNQTLKDIEEGKRINPKDADAAIKYSAAIKSLETETSISQIFEVARLLINRLQALNPQLALQIANEFDALIKERLKKF